MYCLFFGLNNTSLGEFSILFNTNPFFTLILSYLTISEKLPKLEIINMGVSFIGVLLVVFTGYSTANHYSSEINSNLIYVVGVLSTLLAAGLFGYSGIFIKYVPQVHFSIFNTVDGFVLLIVSTIVWFIKKYWFLSPEGSYGFTLN